MNNLTEKELAGPWTRFFDMHSGGKQKEKWENIYMQASEKEAIVIFYNRFGHNPNRVTCTCCGEDYSMTENKNLAQCTAYERNCKWTKDGYIEEKGDSDYRKYIPLNEYINSTKAHFIFAENIKPEEREGEVPRQGYIWQD
jgi:glutamate formiminotransferase